MLISLEAWLNLIDYNSILSTVNKGWQEKKERKQNLGILISWYALNLGLLEMLSSLSMERPSVYAPT